MLPLLCECDESSEFMKLSFLLRNVMKLPNYDNETAVEICDEILEL